MIEMKAMGRHILNREGVPGNLMWAEDGRSFTIGDDKVVALSDFCGIYQLSIQQLQGQLDELMLGWKPQVDLSLVADDFTCRQPGWCFLDKPGNGLHQAYKSMVRRAWTSSFRGQHFAKGGRWLPGACQSYLEAGIQSTILAYNAVHITSSLPARGTEMNSIRLVNTRLAMRNVFVREGKIMIAISYNKSRASNNHSFHVIRFLRPDVASAILLYVAYIRPFMDFLANQLEMPQYYSNEFLFRDPTLKRNHLSSSQITVSMRSLTRHLRTPWTLSLYQQASLAIAKRYISEIIKEENFYFPSDATTPLRMIAAGVGHHPRMLLTAYAIDRALPARLQPELLEMYFRLCKIWQQWNEAYYKQHCMHEAKHLHECNSAMPSRKRAQSLHAGVDGPRKRRLADLGNTDDSQLSVIEAKTTGTIASFTYNASYKVVICVACESMMQPGGSRPFYYHLNAHRITGLACDKLVKCLKSLDLVPVRDLNTPLHPVQAIYGLTVHPAFKCELCGLFTIHRERIFDHVATHKLGCSPTSAWEQGKIRSCFVQTFSSAKGLIKWFEVEQSSQVPS